MKNNLHKILFLLLFGFMAFYFTLPGNASGDEANESGIKVMQKEELGSFLAAGDNMTLYSYSKDKKNISNCIEGCAYNWPPFYAESSAVIEGYETKDFATITRDDGKKQTTYKGVPLYRFIRDKYPGDTFGNGIGDVWSIVKP